MPIEITCTSCSKRLRVPDNAAGKRVKCPQCQTILSVPAAGGSAVAAGGARYHLKTEDGQTFGPVPKGELDEWFGEGRITAECQLLREGADQWQWATDLYPQLEDGAAAGGFPGVDAGQSGAADDNPFAFAAADTSPTARITGGRRAANPTKATASSTSYASAAAGAASGEISDKSKMVAGLLGVFLGSLGVHRFYLGYTGIGVAQIFVSLFTCGVGGWWGIIEGIMILTGSFDRDARGRPLRD